MIKYALRCAEGHSFESWFQSADAFESLRDGGHLCCPDCGSSKIEKALMAPKLAQRSEGAPAKTDPPHPAQVEAALRRLRSEVEANSDYVGDRFAQEARAIHLDEAPARAIHGEADAAEARALLEDGVPVLPLPFRATRKTN